MSKLEVSGDGCGFFLIILLFCIVIASCSMDYKSRTEKNAATLEKFGSVGRVIDVQRFYTIVENEDGMRLSTSRYTEEPIVVGDFVEITTVQTDFAIIGRCNGFPE